MEKKFNPADRIQDLQYFGEFGGCKSSISDSSTYTFLSAKTMFDTFEGNTEGYYLYYVIRHSFILNKATAAMEGTKNQQTLAASGTQELSSYSFTIMWKRDHIVSSRTIYGGTYAFLYERSFPEWASKPHFVDITKLECSWKY